MTIIFISQPPAASGTSSSPLASIHFQRKIFEIRRSSQLFRTSGLSSRILTLLCFFFSLYRSFFVLNHASLMRLRALSSGSRGFISRSFSKFVRSCALAIISVLSRILCLASSFLFPSSSFLLRFISLSALLSQTPLTWCSPYRCGNSRLDCV